MNTEKRFIRKGSLALAVVLSLFALTQICSAAEKFPSREIVIVNFTTAGGSNDLSTRIIAENLKKELNVPVVVECRTDAGGVKGVVDVYRGKPDGYLLLSNLIPRIPMMEVLYDAPHKVLEMTYLPAFMGNFHFVTVRKDSPYKTLKDLIEGSKKKSLNCAITSMGSVAHLYAMILKKKLGVNLEIVPFPKGSAPAMMSLLGGHTDVTTVENFAVYQQMDKVRPLVIFNEERIKQFPDVPTYKELGYHDLPVVFNALGISGPPGMPADITKILSDALTKSIKDPEAANKTYALGNIPIYMTGPEFYAKAKYFYAIAQEYKPLLVEPEKK